MDMTLRGRSIWRRTERNGGIASPDVQICIGRTEYYVTLGRAIIIVSEAIRPIILRWSGHSTQSSYASPSKYADAKKMKSLPLRIGLSIAALD